MQITGYGATIQSINYSPGSSNTASLGRQGELLTAPVHGAWYNAARAGNLFHGSTAAAGTTIPVSSATAATFTLYNPAGSGVNVELLEYLLGTTTSTIVVSTILLGLSPVPCTAPSSVTAITATLAKGMGGLGTPAAQLYSAATIVATTNFYPMMSMSATSGLYNQVPYRFEGGMIIPQGAFVHVCGFAAQTAATNQRFTWAEWPA